LFTLFFIIMFSIWTIDVSLGAVLTNGCVTNGFVCSDPIMVYHVNLRNLICSVFALVVLFIWMVSTRTTIILS
jgi:hypothetical protein